MEEFSEPGGGGGGGVHDWVSGGRVEALGQSRAVWTEGTSKIMEQGPEEVHCT